MTFPLGMPLNGDREALRVAHSESLDTGRPCTTCSDDETFGGWGGGGGGGRVGRSSENAEN